MVRFLGVPPEVEARAAPEERERITELMRSILPLSRRVAEIIAEGAKNFLAPEDSFIAGADTFLKRRPTDRDIDVVDVDDPNL